MTDFITLMVSAGGIAAQVITLILLFCLVAKKKNADVYVLFSRYGIVLAFLMALVAMLTSLYYSEIALFAPCVLCWYQRIFMYPLVFILGLSLIRKEKNILPYAILLSAVGTIVALIHVSIIYMQKSGFCSPTDTVSCTENYFTVFGYMSIPMLSFSAFALITILLIAARQRYEKNS